MTRDNRWLRFASVIAVSGAVYADVGKAAESNSLTLTDSTPRSSQVPVTASGAVSVQKQSADRIHIAITGHVFTSRLSIEQYLAYRAAELAKSEHSTWFVLTENRSKADNAPAPHPDPGGPRFSFRMEYWRPMWHIKTASSPEWKRGSPFSGAAFIAGDPKDIAAYQVSADIVLHKGAMASDNPLAFDAEALSDFLVNQVSPPQ